MTLNDILKKPDVTLAEVQKHLRALAPAERVRQATSVDRSVQAVMWRIAEKGDPITENDLVPANRKALDPIPFEGQNNLPAFRRFQKVFYRQGNGTIAGYNNQAMGWFTGPGYYIVRAGNPKAPNAYIDYEAIPTEKPEGWPAIKRNDTGISQFVYGWMQDYLRRVDGLILIGRATIKKKDTANYFVLAHE